MVWPREGVNCKLTCVMRLYTDTYTRLTMRRQKLNWQLPPFLIIIKAAAFSLTPYSRWQLLMEALIGSSQIALGLYTVNLLEICVRYVFLLRALHAACYIKWRPARICCSRGRLKPSSAECEPPSNTQHGPKMSPPFSRVVRSLISRCLLQSQLVCLTWSRGQKLL